MKRLLTTTAIAACLLTGTAAHALDLSPEARAKLDALTKKHESQRIETPAAKAALKKASSFLVKPVAGRSCDTDDAANPTCEMEDGTAISIEAVPVKLSQAEADVKCASDYVYAEDSNAPDGIRITTREVSKVEFKPAGAKFKLLWCTYAAQDWSSRAAENRVKWGDVNVIPEVEVAEYKITTGKLIRSFGSVHQAISIKNNTRTAERLTFIECGFFLKGELVGTGLGGVGNLMPGMTKHTTVLGLGVEKADKVECSVKD